MKICAKCGVEKPLCEFPQRDKTGAVFNQCVICRREAHRKAVAKYRKTERGRAYLKKKRKKKRKKYAATPRCIIKMREYALRYKFNISIDEYNSILKKQDNKCAICNMSETQRNLAVDHCHKTGKIRGLLCNRCNKGIGLFSDNTTRLTAAIAYIEKHSTALPQPVPSSPCSAPSLLAGPT